MLYFTACHYLHNSRFVIRTDHKPLKYLLESPMRNKKVQLWALSIAGYDCEIEYLPGKRNVIADFLSRPPRSKTTVLSDNQVCEPDINKKSYKVHNVPPVKQISVVNSTQLNLKQVVDYALEATCDLPEAVQRLQDFDMVEEQSKDADLLAIKTKLRHGQPSKSEEQRQFVVLYFKR